MDILKNVIDFFIDLFLNRKRDQLQNWYNDPITEKVAEEIKPPKPIKKPKLQVIWSYPVNNKRVTSRYGWRILLGKKRWHSGTDFTGKNRHCIAPTDCIIIKVLKPDQEYPVKFKYNARKKKFERIKGIPSGRAWTPHVIAQCKYDKKIRFAFKHVDCTGKVGQEIKVTGDMAAIGNWGYSMGSHLHFEIQILKLGKWTTVDPVKFLDKKIKESKEFKNVA